jgi:hypothetical protein
MPVLVLLVVLLVEVLVVSPVLVLFVVSPVLVLLVVAPPWPAVPVVDVVPEAPPPPKRPSVEMPGHPARISASAEAGKTRGHEGSFMRRAPYKQRRTRDARGWSVHARRARRSRKDRGFVGRGAGAPPRRRAMMRTMNVRLTTALDYLFCLARIT